MKEISRVIESAVTNNLGYKHNSSWNLVDHDELSLQIHLGGMESATGNGYNQDLFSMMDMSSAIDSAGVRRYVHFQEPSEVLDALEEFKRRRLLDQLAKEPLPKFPKKSDINDLHSEAPLYSDLLTNLIINSPSTFKDPKKN